jgi:ABC-type branched-subunit amino acid transport system substrate-binding protein
MVGVQPRATALFPPGISLARVKGAQTVGVFREVGSNDIYFQAVRLGTLEAAEDNKLQIVADLTVPYSSSLTESAKNNMKQIIAQLQELKPDVVAGAVLLPGCQAFVQAAKEMNYTAPAILLSECLTYAKEFKAALGDAGRYVSGTSLWDRRLTGRIYKEDGSSSLHYFPATVSIISH